MCSLMTGLMANRFGKTMPGYNGNIDITNRPIVENGDGSYSTVRSMGFNDGEKEVVIPTVSDDDNPRIMSDDEAIEYYYEGPKRRGEKPRYLGRFDTVEEANAFARKLHDWQHEYYKNKRKGNR